MDKRKMEKGVALLIEGMGFSLTDPDFKRTPQRVAKMYTELLKHPGMTKLVSFPAQYTGMVILRHHTVHTMCPHHLLPVEMDVSVAYIPNKLVIGLSKLARVAEAVLTKPLKQEEYTDLVSFKLYQLCDPKGVAVHVIGRHGCMRHRGVKTRGDVVTQVVRGAFLMNAATRQEFLDSIK